MGDILKVCHRPLAPEEWPVKGIEKVLLILQGKKPEIVPPPIERGKGQESSEKTDQKSNHCFTRHQMPPEKNLVEQIGSYQECQLLGLQCQHEGHASPEPSSAPGGEDSKDNEEGDEALVLPLVRGVPDGDRGREDKQTSPPGSSPSDQEC